MTIKLTINEIKEILKHAENNYSGGHNASCVILINGKNGKIEQVSGYAECVNLYIPVTATICEI